MKALLLTAPSTLAMVDLPTPEPAPGEALLRIRACGICGSDLHGWDGSSGRRRPPLVMGHEASGEIAALGDGVEGWSVGDRVTFDSTIFCGECDACLSGRNNLCGRRRVVGVAPVEYSQAGAFAEFLALPTRILHRLPAALPFTRAALVEPTAIALHAVRLVALRPTDTVVVVGAGMIGLLIVQALRWAGVARIVALDLSDARLALARRLGATHAFNSRTDDVPARVDELTDGLGADATFEVVGATATVNLAIHLARRGGSIVLVGNLAPKTDGFPLQRVVTGEQTIRGSCGAAPDDYRLGLELIGDGTIDAAAIITATAPLAEGPAWFQRLTHSPGDHLKVVLIP